MREEESKKDKTKEKKPLTGDEREGDYRKETCK